MSKIYKNIKYKLLNMFENLTYFNLDNNEPNSGIPKMIANFCADEGLTNSYGEDVLSYSTSNVGSNIVYPEISNLSDIREICYFLGASPTKRGAFKQLIAIDVSQNMYITSLDNGASNYVKIETDFPDNSIFQLIPYNYENNCCLVISANGTTETKNYLYAGFGANPTMFFDLYPIYEIINHNNKMFVVFEIENNSKIYYGDDCNPNNLSTGIKDMMILQMPSNSGSILKLIELEDNLFVFCEYGIYKVTSYSKQKDVTIEQVYMGSSLIARNTIVHAGDNIMFCDEDGIYKFNGISIEKLKLNCDSLFKNIHKNNSLACFSCGKYYLATRLKYSDGIVDFFDASKNNCLIVYDINSEKFEFVPDVSVREMIAFQDAESEKICMLSGSQGLGEINLLRKTGLYNWIYSTRKIWKSCDYDFNKPLSKKLLKQFYIKTSQDINIIFNTEDGSFTYKILGNNAEQKITLNKKFKTLSVSIISQSKMPNISSFKLLVGEYE